MILFRLLLMTRNDSTRKIFILRIMQRNSNFIFLKIVFIPDSKLIAITVSLLILSFLFRSQICYDLKQKTLRNEII